MGSGGDTDLEGKEVDVFPDADFGLFWKSIMGVRRPWKVVRADESSSSYKKAP